MAPRIQRALRVVPKTWPSLEEDVKSAFINTSYQKNIPWVGQTDVGLGVLTEAHLAQEAGFIQYEGVVTLVEKMVGTMESLMICQNSEHVGALRTHDIVGKGWVTALNAQHMGGLNGRLEEITAPLGGPMDEQPLGVIVDLEREMGRREDTIEVFSRGAGISKRLINLL